MARLPMVTGLALFALIHVTMSISVQEFFPEINNNLTKIKWAHAANSNDKLNKALNSSEVMMIEADVVFGYQKLRNGTKLANQIPVMAHPPEDTSDLSLFDFITNVQNHNKNNVNKTRKGIKLDFKSAEAFQKSILIINQAAVQFDAPVWLNADVLNGPNATNDPMPVEPKAFLNEVRSISTKAIKPVLSMGWTTGYVVPSGNATTTGNYTNEQITAMLKVANESSNLNLSITYPVRACYAANSIEAMKDLLSKTPAKNNATLTIWSADNDKVDTNKLSELIRTIGVTKVFVDVSKDIFDKLDVNSAFAAKSSVFVVFASMIIALFTAKFL